MFTRSSGLGRFDEGRAVYPATVGSGILYDY